MARKGKGDTPMTDTKDDVQDYYDRDLGPSVDEVQPADSGDESNAESNGTGKKLKRRAFDLDKGEVETLSAADIQPETLDGGNRAQWPRVLAQVADDVLSGKVGIDPATNQPQYVRVATYTQRQGAKASLRNFKKRIEQGETQLYPEGYNGTFDFVVQPLKDGSKLWVRYTPAD